MIVVVRWVGSHADYFNSSVLIVDVLIVVCGVCDEGFKVLRVADIDKRAESVSKTSQTVVDDFAAHTTVNIGGRPKYISVNSDSTTVSVCFKDQQINIVQLYDIHSFKAPVL